MGHLQGAFLRWNQRLTSGKTISLVALICLTQASILLSDETAAGSIPMASVISAFGEERDIAAGFLLFAGLSAMSGVSLRALPSHFRRALFAPQQAVLLVLAAGAIGAIVRQSYADGVLRSWGFIMSDQLYLVMALVAHSIAISARELDW